ncbi:MAG: MG2 domain-containing protein [Thermosynechococcaceae cyanobacterium]
MRPLRSFVAIALWFGISLCLTLWLPSCQFKPLVPAVPLADVAPLPTPTLPDWIEHISPTGPATPLAQIRIRFKGPLIPLEALDSPDQQALLEKFQIAPALPGHFRFLTPRMVGFEPEQALPQATRIQVTLKAGLGDLQTHRLAQDLAWTFNTPTIQLTNLPGLSDPKQSLDNADPIDLKPTLKVTSNVELDLDSLRSHAKLLPDGSESPIALTATLEEPKADPTETDTPQTTFDPSARQWVYVLTPQSTLAKGQPHRLEFETGIRPAHGNLASETVFASRIKTYGPLAFQKMDYVGQPDAGGAYGRFTQGRAILNFNNGLVAQSVRKALSVSPAPKDPDHLVQTYDGDRTIALNPWAFEPNTAYTLTLGPELKDQFGQTLEKPLTVPYQTGTVAPDLWAPTGLHIFPTGKDLQLNLSAVNLPDATYKAAYRVIQPEALVYKESAYPNEDANDWLPAPATWTAYPIPQPKSNETAEITVPLRDQLGGPTGMLAYGVSARTNRYTENGKSQWREPSFYGLVQLTNLGVFGQWFPDGGFVRVHHLDDGSAAGGVTVTVYESKLESTGRSQPTPCATATADPTGMVRFDRTAIQGCLPPNNRTLAQPPQLLIVAREGADWAFTRILEYSGAYDYGTDLGWNGGKPESRGTIFSDRQLYQPNEKGWFTGVAYYLQEGEIRPDKNARYTVTLEGPNGKTTDLGTQQTNGFGTFSLEVPLVVDQPLGYYTLRAKGEGDREISGEFRVAEFKPPNFKVDLSLPPKFATLNQTIAATAQSNYLFGPPVEGGKVNVYVTRKPVDFTPQGWDTFTFGRRWTWPEERPEVPTDVLQTSQSLDSQGRSQTEVKIASDLPYPMTYRVDVQVADVSNLAVSDSQTLTALPSDRLIGLKTDFVATANQGIPIEVIVTDPDGKAISNQSVQLDLQQVLYSNVTQVVEGSRSPHNQVEYKTVARTEVQSAANPVSASLTATESGSYRIRAHFGGGQDDRAATDAQLWVSGDNPVFWGDRYRNERIEVKLDKASYKPGETATALIQSPYPEAELYFAVLRHKVLYQITQTVQGSTPKIQFQVTPEMLPNAAIEAVVVRKGKPLAQTQPGSLKNLVGIGFAPFKTNVDSQRLQVQVTPTGGTEPGRFLLPGANQTLNLTLQDGQNRPVKGQLAIMAVNEAVLQLSGYRIPNLVDMVYAEQPISTRFADNRADVILAPLASPLDKGWGYGGGFSAGAASTRIRTDFKPLAYYNGSVLTDAEGKAQVTFPLPDDLTTWRVMVAAADDQLRFGNGETTFMTSKPLISNPILPQFARPGDRFEAGLSVTNNTGQKGDLAINGTLADPGPSPAIAFTKAATLQTPVESGTQAYRFPIEAKAPGQSTVQFKTQLGGESDAFAVPLDIKPLTITEQVVESGTTRDRVQIPLTVPPATVPDLGGLEVSLASTLIPEIMAPAQAVLQEEQLPFLEPAASQLAITAHLQRLSQTYPQTFTAFDPPQQAIAALERLQKLQRPDGGLAAWPEQKTADPYVTPVAALAIGQGMTAFPNEAALKSDAVWVTRLRTYLNRLLADPAQVGGCKETPCKVRLRLNALIALAELGDPRTDFLPDLYEQRSQLDSVEQIQLARYLSRFPDWQTEAATLTQQIQQNLAETGRTATLNLPRGWGWLGSPAVQQAETLKLFVAQNASGDLLDRQVQSLLNLRRNGHWGSTYDNAAALGALAEYSRREATPPSFAAEVKLANQSLGSTRFDGYRNPNYALTVPLKTLPTGKQDLTLTKSGQGELHYLAALRYRLPGNPPGRFNGLRVTRTVRPANQSEVLQTFGLTVPKAPLTVEAAQVFDIGLEIITDRPVDRVEITDPLPAGFEAVDTRFQTATAYFQPLNESWQINYQTLHRDRIVAFGDRLDPGVYNLHYLVRSVTPGTFLWPGAEVHLQYAPEEFGRSTTAQVIVK